MKAEWGNSMIAGMIVTALVALSGCSNAATIAKASSPPAAPGSFMVHMNGEMTNAIGASNH